MSVSTAKRSCRATTTPSDRIPGTDLYLRSAELDSAAQYTYTLAIDYEEGTPDPRNDIHGRQRLRPGLRGRACPTGRCHRTLEPPAEDAPRGELDSFQFRSEILDNTRQIQVWRPPGYGSDPETRYPVLVVNHGDNLLRGGLMRNTLDNLVGKDVAPLVAVFVPRSFRSPSMEESRSTTTCASWWKSSCRTSIVTTSPTARTAPSWARPQRG